jgi:hypothetical protein
MFFLKSVMLATAVLAVGCSTETSGADGKDEFSYQSCLLGCGMDKHMMVGTTEAISVSASNIPSVSIASSNGGIFEIGVTSRTCCEQGGAQTCRTAGPSDTCEPNENASLSVTVSALAAGDADLQLVEGGTVYDSVTLHVSEPVGLKVTCAENSNNNPVPSTMADGEQCVLGWSATDSGGNDLLATTGVTFTSSDVDVVAFLASPPLLGPPSTPVATLQPSQALFQQATLSAQAQGNAVVTATASHATLAIPIAVGP